LGIRTERFEETARFFREVMGLEETRRERDVVGFAFPDGAEMEVWRPEDEFHSFFGAGPVVGPPGGRIGRGPRRDGGRGRGVSGAGTTLGKGSLEPIPGARRQRLRDHHPALEGPASVGADGSGATGPPPKTGYYSPPGPRSPGPVLSVPSPSGRFSLRLVAWPEITPKMMIPKIASGTRSMRDTMAMLTGRPFSRVQRPAGIARRPPYYSMPGFVV